MTKTTKKKKITKKKYTLTEFQAWLTGIEEIQPDDWHPDFEQWRLIRERIAGIIPDVEIIEREIEVPVPVPMPGPPMVGPGFQFPTPSPQPVLQPEPVHEISPAAEAALRGEMPKDGAQLHLPNPTAESGVAGEAFEKSTFA